MTSYFGRVRGGGTYHLEDEEGVSLQFCVGYFGEDETLLVEAFWKEEGAGSFLVAPIIAYGKAPRSALCSRASLLKALETTKVNPDSREGQQWREACQRHGIQWPKTKPKAA